MEQSVHNHHQQTFFLSIVRVLVIFFLLTLWAFFIAIGYGYRGVEGLPFIGWIRLPEGLEPFIELNLAMADIIAYTALFVAILLAATVQMNSTVAAADDIASVRPQTAEEASQQQDELQVYANQAEMSMIVSFGAAFAALLLTALFGLQEMAEAAGLNGEVDAQGVGWVVFAEHFHVLLHPRVVFMYFVSFLLFLTTYASMPSWKNTGLFRRREEENSWDARKRLDLITTEHDLDNVHPIYHPAGITVATVAGYALYVFIFVLALNLALSIFAGDAGFESLLTLQRWPMLLLLAVIAIMISTAVASLTLRKYYLQSAGNVWVVVSLVLALVAVLYVVWAEGASWTFSILVVAVLYAILWRFLYAKAVGVLDEKHPKWWEFVVNPPKFVVVRRYETIRISAQKVTPNLAKELPENAQN